MLIFTCLKIFFARIVDVSLGVVRTNLQVRGKSMYASLIAFIEVFIWFMVAKEALSTEINSLWIPIFYSLGFATGTFLGTFISKKFITGIVGIQIITAKDNEKLISEIRKNGYGLSIVDLKNKYEGTDKEMYFVQAKKKNTNDITSLVRKIDPDAFIVINETKYIQNGLIK